MTPLPPRQLSNRRVSIRYRGTVTVLWYLVSWIWLEALVQTASLQELSYAVARTTRALHGHIAALPLYQELLRRNPQDVTAATRIACHPDTIQRHQRLGGDTANLHFTPHKNPQTLTRRLQEWGFTPLGIADHIFPSEKAAASSHHSLAAAAAARLSSAPLYLQPLRAGSPAPPLPTSTLDTCIQLFVLAVCVPLSTCQYYLGDDIVELMEEIGVAFCNHDENNDDGWVVPYCHITPVQSYCGQRGQQPTLYLATDLHPNVLSTTTITTTSVDDQSEEAVMYIGPDSLALVDHWNSLPHLFGDGTATQTRTHHHHHHHRIVDLGTGSGIQALTMVLALRHQSSEEAKTNNKTIIDVVCVDRNPRALRLARLNFAWNGIPMPDFILGDLKDDRGGTQLFDHDSNVTLKPWKEWIGRPTILLANPPFLPVPVHDPTIAKRHGLFSSGGASGEEILERIIELSSECLCCDNDNSGGGTLAVVSEFMNPQTTFPSRLKKWWERKSCRQGRTRVVLFSNEQALEASTYATRRADSQEEFEKWMDNLSKEGIAHVSPGLLFIQHVCAKHGEVDAKLPNFQMESVLIPKTRHGSIWTPTNLPAREFTRKKLTELKIYPNTH